MKHRWRRFYNKIPYQNLLTIIVVFLLGVVAVGWGMTYRDDSTPVPPEPIAKPTYELSLTAIPAIATPARAFVLLRADTGSVVTEQSDDVVLPLASITKLFAATTALTDFSTTSAVVTWADLSAPGEAGLVPDSTMTLYELLFPLLLVSSNDAAATMDRATAGGVVTAMNMLADSLSLDATFTEPSGYDDGNVGSALSVARFARHVYENQPHLLDITTLRQYVGEETVWQNNNPFAGEPGYRGGKNGYTIPANRTIVAIFDEVFPTPEGATTTIPLVYVVLGSPSAADVVRELRSFVAESSMLSVVPILTTRPTE